MSAIKSPSHSSSIRFVGKCPLNLSKNASAFKLGGAAMVESVALQDGNTSK